MSYVPADFFTTQAATGLLDALDAFSGSSYADGDYVNGQLGQMASSIQGHGQTRFEDAKRETEEQSVLKIVAGTTMAFGAADTVEGIQDAYKDFSVRDWGDLSTRSFNFVCDRVFGGNEGAYGATEGVLVAACALAGPAGEILVELKDDVTGAWDLARKMRMASFPCAWSLAGADAMARVRGWMSSGREVPRRDHDASLSPRRRAGRDARVAALVDPAHGRHVSSEGKGWEYPRGILGERPAGRRTLRGGA